MLEHIGEASRDARRQAGLRQLDVATTAGVSHVTISRFERGKSWPLDPDRVVAAYAEELRVDPIELWTAALDRWRPGG